jgi:hypothetical protein
VAADPDQSKRQVRQSHNPLHQSNRLLAPRAGSFSSSFSKSFNHEVMALDPQSKKLLWKYTPTDGQFPFYSSAAIADGKVVLAGRDKMVHALEAKRPTTSPHSDRHSRTPRSPTPSRRSPEAATFWSFRPHPMPHP